MSAWNTARFMAISIHFPYFSICKLSLARISLDRPRCAMRHHATSCDIMRRHRQVSSWGRIMRSSGGCSTCWRPGRARRGPWWAIQATMRYPKNTKKIRTKPYKTIQNLQYPTIRSISMQKTSFEDIWSAAHQPFRVLEGIGTHLQWCQTYGGTSCFWRKTRNWPKRCLWPRADGWDMLGLTGLTFVRAT